MSIEDAETTAGEVTSTSEVTTDAPAETGKEATPETQVADTKSDDKYLKRINKLTWQRSEARREAESLRRKIQELEAKSSKPATDEQEPKETDFQSYAEYLRALARYETNQRLKTEKQESEANTLKQTKEQYRAQISSEFQERISEFKEKTEDFEEVVEGSGIFDLPDSPTVEAMSLAMAESDLGAQILYHLAQNMKEASRIARLSPYAAAREIGKLEAKLSTPAPKKPSQAPEPITPVGGKEPVKKDPEKMPIKEWMAKRNKELGR